MTDSAWSLKESKMEMIILCFSYQVGDGGSCIYMLAWAGFAHMRSDSPTTEFEQQSNFSWVCLHHHSSPQP